MSSSQPPPPTPAPQSAMVGYRFHHLLTAAAPEVLWLVEDPQLVLLGGEVWPSAFPMAEYLETTFKSEEPCLPAVVVELGAGAGLCGLVAAAAVLRAQKQQQHQQRRGGGGGGGCRVFLTDESPELAAINVDLFRKEWLREGASGDGGDHGAAAMSVEVGGTRRIGHNRYLHTAPIVTNSIPHQPSPKSHCPPGCRSPLGHQRLS